MFTYVTITRPCYNGNVLDAVLESEKKLTLFNSLTEAHDAAYAEAEAQADELNEGADEGISFGVPENEDDYEVIVNYYYDDNTEWVTKRIVVEVKE